MNGACLRGGDSGRGDLAATGRADTGLVAESRVRQQVRETHRAHQVTVRTLTDTDYRSHSIRIPGRNMVILLVGIKIFCESRQL